MAPSTFDVMDECLLPSPFDVTADSLVVNDRPTRRRFATDGRVRSGCLTCKARKKKCDEQYSDSDGRCKTCERLGLVCERQPLRTVIAKPKEKKGNRDRKAKEKEEKDLNDTDMWTRSSSSSGSSPKSKPVAESLDDRERLSLVPVSSTERSSGFMTLFSLENASPERILLKYYVERLAPLCSILQEGNNDFRNVLLPMAIDDSSLLYALFAYASTQLPLSDPVPCITPLTRLKFESEVARGLSESIRRNTVSESTVASALICSTAEVVSGDTKRWYIHLQGAGHLIDHLGGPQRLRRTSDGCFLLRNFAYHDIMAALSTSSRPRYRGMYWLNDGHIPVDSLMGVAHEILGHISHICCFIADVNELPSASSDCPSSVVQQGENLAQLLRSQPLGLCTTVGGNDLDLLIHHAEALRFAALIHLYRFLDRFAREAYVTQMRKCVQNIMDHSFQIPSNLYCEIGLLFPLFMTGVVAGDDKGNADYIRNRLDNIESWTKFKHVTRVRELLDSLWLTNRTDWETLLQEWDWHISLA
ncbi:uncharacterized protein Z518_00888 [Rhinocladiella mackenziei CBS 650.93]|uniref:Zn(2)-C6 fungal-type domain-containing protein n=1 Tax=Rhinocladiella mackenziei CBS 650.93 TaxID=1442369 RepID=A0A0D2G4Y7_9EURO|nr:uncharacterized protein Z518_00888 [Rhinocladiella mackenziei CBS 650.93]KIX09807.1 hypothetical protein Z518_00888 [Rhinocladiella mackenziei CBS 650.93]